MLTKLIRYTVLGALFLIPFLPLYVANGLFFPFITGKHFIFRILVEVAVIGWGVLMLLDVRYRPRFSWMLVLYGALVVWMFVADLFAVNPHKAFWSNYERMDGWVTLVHVFGFFLVTAAVLSAENLWRRWWLTFLGASAFVCLYGFMQLAGLFTINQGGVRVDATMGNAAYLATYLLFVIAVALWKGFESKGAMRYTLWGLAFMQGILLYHTATRGALLGFVGASILGTVLYLLHTKGKARKVGVGILVGLAVVIGAFFLVKDSAWVQTEPTLARLSSITLADGATRFALWNMALEGVAKRPVFGWGHEGFNYIFNAGYVPSLYAQEPWFDRAHNLFIDWLVAGGIPALLLFASLIGLSVVVFYRKGNEYERIILVSVIGAYTFQGMFVFDNLFSYVPLAALFAYAHILSSRPIQKLEELPRLSESQVGSMALPVAVVLGVIVVWTVNIPSMQAGNDLIQGLTPRSDPRENLAYFERALARGPFATQEIREQLMTYAGTVSTQPQIPNEIKFALASAAVTEIAKEVERTPADARLRLEYSYAYRSLGDYAGAKRELAIAQSLSPKKQTLIIEEGVLALQEKNYPAARAAFKRAFDLDTSFSDLAAYVAAGEILSGDIASAKTFLVDYFGTTTVPNGIVILAYYEVKNFKELIPLLEYRVVLDPNDATTNFQLATVYAESGRVEDAKTLIRAYMKEHPETATQAMQFLTSLESAR